MAPGRTAKVGYARPSPPTWGEGSTLPPVSMSALAAHPTPHRPTVRPTSSRRPTGEGVKPVPAGIAAGHPATAEVGLRILHAGGTAADPAVSAALASCVAESVLTRICGGGFATDCEASSPT